MLLSIAWIFVKKRERERKERGVITMDNVQLFPEKIYFKKVLGAFKERPAGKKIRTNF